MKDFLKVSIMIPTYNQEKYIEEAIKSALIQDYSNIEIVVGDDCSTDRTGEIAQKYHDGEKVKYFRNTKNEGRVKNYRKCLYEYSTGDYAVNLDGDDLFINPSFISTAMEHITANNNVVFYMSGKYREGKKKKTTNIPIIDGMFKNISGQQYVKNYLQHRHFSHLTTVYDRKKAMDIDFYRENISSSDIESLFRLALKGNVILSKSIDGVWRYTGYNEGTNPDIRYYFRSNRWIKSVYQELKKQSPLSAFLWKQKVDLFQSSAYVKAIRISTGTRTLLNLFFLLCKFRLFVYTICRVIQEIMRRSI